jgi:hypothetical protein
VRIHFLNTREVFKLKSGGETPHSSFIENEAIVTMSHAMCKEYCRNVSSAHLINNYGGEKYNLHLFINVHVASLNSSSKAA